MQIRESREQTPIAYSALLCALLGIVGAAGTDFLSPIAFAFVLLPACEAAIAANDASREESAPAVFPPRPRRSRLAALAPVLPRLSRRAVASAHRGAIDGVLLPLLS